MDDETRFLLWKPGFEHSLHLIDRFVAAGPLKDGLQHEGTGPRVADAPGAGDAALAVRLAPVKDAVLADILLHHDEFAVVEVVGAGEGEAADDVAAVAGDLAVREPEREGGHPLLAVGFLEPE